MSNYFLTIREHFIATIINLQQYFQSVKDKHLNIIKTIKQV